MKLEITPYPEQREVDTPSERHEHGHAGADEANKRVDRRCEIAAQAFVAIPSLPSRAYEISEISRGGMFLGFKDARSTALELEQRGVEAGVHVDIAFAVTLPDARHRFGVRARISRITQRGIGVQFATRNPPQLAALRELFSAPGEQSAAVVSGPPGSNRAQAREKKVLQKPADSAAWDDWELLD